MKLRNPEIPIAFIPESERGHEYPLTFWIKPFTVDDLHRFMEMVDVTLPADSTDADDVKVGVGNHRELHQSLFANQIVKVENVSWTNSDERHTIDTQQEIEKLRTWMAPMDCVEIIKAIQNERGLDEDDKKK